MYLPTWNNKITEHYYVLLSKIDINIPKKRFTSYLFLDLLGTITLTNFGKNKKQVILSFKIKKYFLLDILTLLLPISVL